MQSQRVDVLTKKEGAPPVPHMHAYAPGHRLQCIIVSFNPQSLGNEKFANLQSVIRVTQAADNGSYTFDPNDLSAFPTGAKIEFTLARGNFIEQKGKTGGNYLLYTSSSTTGFYELK